MAIETVTTRTAESGSIEKSIKGLFESHKSLSSEQGNDLQWLSTQGNFQKPPSPLFLQIYKEVLDAAWQKPHTAVVSPALIGTSGVVPLTVLSIIPDIMRHYADCIRASQREILIATNAWEPGRCVDMVVAAFRDLNKACARENRKVTIKLLMDAASIRNAVQSRYARAPKAWPDISLPLPEDISHLDLEVVNYHVAPLGTFHSKFAVFDRTVALVNSNNINLRSNVELMTRFEGDVVNSLYDTFLISWNRELPQRLPCIDQPAQPFRNFVFLKYNSDAGNHNNNGTTGQRTNSVAEQLIADQQEYYNQNDPHKSIPVNERLNAMKHIEQTATETQTNSYKPYLFHAAHDPVPMALVNRQPHNLPGHGNVVNPQNNAWLAALRLAKRSVFIQSPVCNASPIVSAIADACRRGIVVTVYVGLGFNDFAEGIVPFQGGTNESVLKGLQSELRNHGDEALNNLRWYWYTAKDQTAPVRFEAQARNCHIKFFSVDDEVAILGSGNQDTQSWFHSQEVNIMVDSVQLCQEWKEGLSQIQNTGMFGEVDHHNSTGQLKSGEQLPKKSGFGGLKRSQGGFL